MRLILLSAASALAFVVLMGTNTTAHAQASWRAETKAATGPVAQVALPGSGNKRRTAFVAFEFARGCDPIFSFVEITGSRLGAPISQSILKDTKIGVILNGKFHTWHAAMTKYDNGYEAGFGITNELFIQLLRGPKTLAYVTPKGEHVPLPTDGFREAIQAAVDVCREGK